MSNFFVRPHVFSCIILRYDAAPVRTGGKPLRNPGGAAPDVGRIRPHTFANLTGPLMSRRLSGFTAALISRP